MIGTLKDEAPKDKDPKDKAPKTPKTILSRMGRKKDTPICYCGLCH